MAGLHCSYPRPQLKQISYVCIIVKKKILFGYDNIKLNKEVKIFIVYIEIIQDIKR